jgi:hypothetical protein
MGMQKLGGGKSILPIDRMNTGGFMVKGTLITRNFIEDD